MSEMVERVARAVYEYEHRNVKNCWSWDDPGLDDEHPRARDRYLRNARVAIAAMEPTEAMIEAARNPLVANGSPMSKGPHEVWCAMRDAALK